jgi:ubiquinone/menaquinone biosynthesis C-methylase UbiE
MSAAAPHHEPSPELFFQSVNSYQRTAALRAAVELEVFTAVAEGVATAVEIARRCNSSERGIRILCDYLTVLGFLTKAEGRYAATPDTAIFLDRRSPAYVGDAVRFLLAPELTASFERLTEAVRTGTTQLPAGGSVAPDHPIWAEFARSMVGLIGPAAEELARLLGAAQGGRWKVLDIAAGHGLFGIAIARQNPGAQIVALDWKRVLEVAQENARKAGVEARYSTIAGSAFEADFGGGYDLVLLTNFLHHFDAARCESLLRRVYAALNPGGRAAILEFVPEEDRVGPPLEASFSLIMLASTPSGDAYTFRELETMCRNAGFARAELHAVPRSIEHVVIAQK